MPLRPSPIHLSPESTLPELDLPDGVSCWSAQLIDERRREAKSVNGRSSSRSSNEEHFIHALCQTIDILGLRSQLSQQVNYILTSVARLHENKTFRLYLLTSNKRGIGILKVGVKKLFVTHPTLHSLVEVDPMCILDFYVDERCQRRGFGLQLFNYMINAEHITHVEHLAIDRPSDKLMAFLAKHYHLKGHALQVNNFVVFNRFFDNTRVTERGLLCRLPSTCSNSMPTLQPSSSLSTTTTAAAKSAEQAQSAKLLQCAVATNNISERFVKEKREELQQEQLYKEGKQCEKELEIDRTANISINTINKATNKNTTNSFSFDPINSNQYGNINAHSYEQKSRLQHTSNINTREPNRIAESILPTDIMTSNARIDTTTNTNKVVIPHLTPLGCRVNKRT